MKISAVAIVALVLTATEARFNGDRKLDSNSTDSTTTDSSGDWGGSVPHNTPCSDILTCNGGVQEYVYLTFADLGIDFTKVSTCSENACPFHHVIANTPKGCVITPIRSEDERDRVVAANPLKPQAYVGIQKDYSDHQMGMGRIELANGWTNIADGSKLGGITMFTTESEVNDYWQTPVEPNNENPVGQIRATINRGTELFLRDVNPAGTSGINGAVFLCCSNPCGEDKQETHSNYGYHQWR